MRRCTVATRFKHGSSINLDMLNTMVKTAGPHMDEPFRWFLHISGKYGDYPDIFYREGLLIIVSFTSILSNR
jgi:hypothetical protein